eukprot:scaffold41124_cov32-Tisochrysis_lutea.AAC.3
MAAPMPPPQGSCTKSKSPVCTRCVALGRTSGSMLSSATDAPVGRVPTIGASDIHSQRGPEIL